MSWQTVPQPRTGSSNASVSIAAAGPSDDTCQSAADNDLRRKPADSQWPGKVEPYQTVTTRPKWPSWSSPDAELEASAAPVALALCGHSVEPRHQTCSRILNRLQPAHQTVGDAVEHRVAVVQPTRNKCLDQRLDGVRWHRSDEWSELP